MPNDAIAVSIAMPRGARSWRGPGMLLESWRAGDFPWLRDISIRWRFGLLVALALLSGAAFGGAVMIGEMAISKAMESATAYRRLGDLAAELRAETLAMRYHERAFLESRSADDGPAFRAALQAAAARLEALAAMPQAQPEGEAIAKLRDRLAAVGAQFEGAATLAATLGLTESAGLRGRLHESVAAIEGELKQWPNVEGLWTRMLQMRQAEKDFMLYGGTGHLGRHRKAANEFDFDIDAAALSDSVRGDFRRRLHTYAADMAQFADVSTRLKAETAALREQLDAMQPPMAQLFGFARRGVEAATATQEDIRARMGFRTVLAGMAAALAFVLFGAVLARSVVGPVRMIERAMAELAGGNHGIAVPGAERRDEIGDMARAVEVFKETSTRMVRLIAEQEDIKRAADARHRAQMHELADAFEATVADVVLAVTRGAEAIRDTTEVMASRVDAGSSRSLAVAETAETTRHTVAQVTAAVDELGAAVAEIERYVGDSAAIARSSVEGLARTNQRVAGLSEVADRVGAVVGMIGGIAAQTNLLALNAAIEAARAGEAGKGFAVVAAEVKALASQTAKATEEVACQIDAIQASTRDTVAAIAEIGEAIRRMDALSSGVADAVRHHGGVAGRITIAVEDVSRHAEAVADGLVDVIQSAARNSSAAIGMAWTADDLNDPAHRLRGEVDGFLARVRT